MAAGIVIADGAALRVALRRGPRLPWSGMLWNEWRVAETVVAATHLGVVVVAFGAIAERHHWVMRQSMHLHDLRFCLTIIGTIIALSFHSMQLH